MSADDDAPSPIMTAPEVCELLRIHHSTLYKLIRQEKLPAFKIGADYRFDRRLVFRWIDEAQRRKSQSKRGIRS